MIVNQNIICVTRKRDADVYLGTTQRDSDMLQLYIGAPYIYLAAYGYTLQVLGIHNVSLLVDEAYDDSFSDQTAPGHDDSWLR